MAFEVGGGEPPPVARCGQRGDHAAVHRFEQPAPRRVRQVDNPQLPLEASFATGFGKPGKNRLAAGRDCDRPDVGAGRDPAGRFGAVGLRIGSIELSGLPARAFPERRPAVEIDRREPVAIGGKGEGRDRLAVPLEHSGERAVQRADQKDLPRGPHRTVAADGQQAVARRGVDRIDAPPQTAGDLPADRPLAQEHPPQVAKHGLQIPDLDILVQAGRAESLGIGQKRQSADDRRVPSAV
ncbi:MAG: hypothetical protein PHO07_00150 [Pirellulales bacterium]|nr:hypothetical protein [Pirellulales bacterium]